MTQMMGFALILLPEQWQLEIEVFFFIFGSR